LVFGVRFIAEDSYVVLDGGLDLSMERETSSTGGVLDLENFWLAFTYLHFQIQIDWLAMPVLAELLYWIIVFSSLLSGAVSRVMMIISIVHIDINPRYWRSDGNCPLISDVCNLKHALYSSLI